MRSQGQIAGLSAPHLLRCTPRPSRQSSSGSTETLRSSCRRTAWVFASATDNPLDAARTCARTMGPCHDVRSAGVPGAEHGRDAVVHDDQRIRTSEPEAVAAGPNSVLDLAAFASEADVQPALVTVEPPRTANVRAAPSEGPASVGAGAAYAATAKLTAAMPAASVHGRLRDSFLWSMWSSSFARVVTLVSWCEAQYAALGTRTMGSNAHADPPWGFHPNCALLGSGA